MKTRSHFLLAMFVVCAVSTPVFAQDDADYDGTTYEATGADTVVYDAPTAYYSSVVYQSAVIYNAPVFYMGAAVVTAASCEAEQSCERQAAVASTVTVVGVHGGVYTYSNEPTTCSSSTIIWFGQGGGWFGSR